MIKLRKFEEADIPRLIGWVPDARFLLQWSGPQYSYPLDREQLLDTLEKTQGDKPSHFMFVAVHQPSGTVVGHIELMAVDYGKGTTQLGRVLIGDPTERSKGWGTAMVIEALNYGFKTVGLNEIWLGVFNFNQSAIACYAKLGFVECEFLKNAREIDGEKWNLIKMKLDRETFCKGS